MDPELSKAVNELIILVLSTITTVVIPYLVILGRSWIKAKIERVQNQDTREALEFALTRLDATANTVVAEIEQTRKEYAADGQLSKDDAKKLLTLAYNRIKARLPTDTVEILKNAYAERLQGVIVGKIESKVAAL